MWPRKQSLSRRHVTAKYNFRLQNPDSQIFPNLRMHWPPMHFSLSAHSWSAPQRGKHIDSWQAIPGAQSALELHSTGTRTHSSAGSPVKPAGHEHCLKWPAIRHSAFMPQAEPASWHGFTHWPLAHTSSWLHSSVAVQAAVWI